MCLLLFKPANAKIDQLLAEVDDIARQNADGFGFAYATPSAVATSRGFFTPDDQRKMIEALSPVDAIIHWRFGTSGKRNAANCHPFRLRDGSAFAHNGIIPDASIKPTKKKSDTAMLATIAHDADSFLDIVNTIDIGWSKFAIMRANGATEIVGENDGEWRNGIWFSNVNHLPRTFGFSPRTAWAQDDCGLISDTELESVRDQFSDDASECLRYELDEMIYQYGYRAVCEALEDIGGKKW